MACNISSTQHGQAVFVYPSADSDSSAFEYKSLLFHCSLHLHMLLFFIINHLILFCPFSPGIAIDTSVYSFYISQLENVGYILLRGKMQRGFPAYPSIILRQWRMMLEYFAVFIMFILCRDQCNPVYQDLYQYSRLFL